MRKLLLGALMLVPAVGCMSFRPVGVLDPNGDAAKAIGPEGMQAAAARIPDTPPPPAPVQLVSPDEIDPNNPAEAVKKLAAEIDADRRAVDQFPNYPKVSRVQMR